MGLHSGLHIVVGEKYDLTSNIDVRDGLTNGAECIVKKIDYRVANSSRPSIIWLLFTEQNVGSTQRQEYRSLQSVNANTEQRTWTPIFEVSKQFGINKTSHFNYVRRQFPVRPAAAKTIHRCQGDSLANVAVDFSHRPRDHMHYVGLSRARKLDGLFIRHRNERRITISVKVKMEMECLRLFAQYSPSLLWSYNVPGTLSIFFQNVRSLVLHKDDVFHDFNVMSADVNIVVETNLTKSITNKDVSIPNFDLYRNDNCDTTVQACYGTALYIRQGLKVLSKPSRYNANGVEITISMLNRPVTNFHIVSIYTSTKVPFSMLLQAIQSVHENFLKNNSAVIIGDFNVDILQNTLQTEQLLTCMESIGFKQLIDKETTDFGSLLDHVYTNIPSFVLASGVLESYYSDHKPIILSFK